MKHFNSETHASGENPFLTRSGCQDLFHGVVSLTVRSSIAFSNIRSPCACLLGETSHRMNRIENSIAEMGKTMKTILSSVENNMARVFNENSLIRFAILWKWRKLSMRTESFQNGIWNRLSIEKGVSSFQFQVCV